LTLYADPSLIKLTHMTHSSTQDLLIQLFHESNTPVPEWLFEFFDPELLIHFYNFLKDTNDRGGFFSKNDSERIFTRHFFESIVFAHYVSHSLSVSRETKIADAGSGPGLPGYLFACMINPPSLTLIDSSRRRLSLLEEFHIKLKGHNPVNFSYSRLEDMKDSFDIITARALIPFPFVIELICRSVKKNGHAVIFSADDRQLSDREDAYLKKLGFVSRETLLPEEVNIDSRRTIKILQKIETTSRIYPRDWKKIKDEIVLWQK